MAAAVLEAVGGIEQASIAAITCLGTIMAFYVSRWAAKKILILLYWK